MTQCKLEEYYSINGRFSSLYWLSRLKGRTLGAARYLVAAGLAAEVVIEAYDPRPCFYLNEKGVQYVRDCSRV